LEGGGIGVFPEAETSFLYAPVYGSMGRENEDTLQRSPYIMKASPEKSLLSS